MPRFRWLTYANVVSTLCLFVVLGGAAYAVSVAKHSVGTKQLKRNAVVSKKVADGSLRAVDFGAGQLPQGPQGAQGEQGSQGPQGGQGATGPAGPTAGAATSAAGTPPVTPSPRTTAGATQITAPSAGKLMVLGRFESANWQCLNIAGPCTLAVGLYVDGQPVAGTLASANLPAGSNVTAFGSYDHFGVSAPVQAGTHTVRLQATETAGLSTAGLESIQGLSVGAILLGG